MGRGDVFDVLEGLERVYSEDQAVYRSLERHHAEVGNALLDSRENGDMVSVVELHEDTGVSQQKIGDVVNGLYRLERIEIEEDVESRFYDLNSYTLEDRNTVEQALERFDPTQQ